MEEGHHTWTVVPSCSGASRSIRIPLEFLGNSVLSVPSPHLCGGRESSTRGYLWLNHPLLWGTGGVP